MDKQYYDNEFALGCDKDCKTCKKSPYSCDGKFDYWEKQKCNFAIHTFTPYFDVTMGKNVESEQEIKEYCAKNNMVYADDKDISIDCERNKRENETRFNNEFTETLTKELMEHIN